MHFSVWKVRATPGTVLEWLFANASDALERDFIWFQMVSNFKCSTWTSLQEIEFTGLGLRTAQYKNI